MSISLPFGTAFGNGFVQSIDKAPVANDGTVTGSYTDIVVTLSPSLDPKVEGFDLHAGDTIKIKLDKLFLNSGKPVRSIGLGCAPLFLPAANCSTGVLLQGWPQHPIAPPNYSISLAASNTIMFAMNSDVPANPPSAPGLKQIHLLLFGFINPHPGHYNVDVIMEDVVGNIIHEGQGKVHIIPKKRPSINITSVFNDGTPNTIYQQTTILTETPLPFDFLLWDREGNPFLDVDIEPVGSGENSFLLMRDNRMVGTVLIDAPQGASGYDLRSTPSTEIVAPVTGIPTGHYQVIFKSGNASGVYTITFSLNGGNTLQMFVHVI